MSFAGTFNLTVTMTTGPCNLVSHPNGVFLRESSLGHSVIDSLGKRSCIRRIPIRSNYGEVEFDNLQSGTRDFIDCSGANLRNLHFRLTDDKGSVIPLEARQYRNDGASKQNRVDGHVALTMLAFGRTPREAQALSEMCSLRAKRKHIL